MTPTQIERLKLLDPDGVNGTIQSVLLRDDLHTQSSENTLYWLLKMTLLEKETLIKENRKYFKVLKKHNLMTNELMTEK